MIGRGALIYVSIRVKLTVYLTVFRYPLNWWNWNIINRVSRRKGSIIDQRRILIAIDDQTRFDEVIFPNHNDTSRIKITGTGTKYSYSFIRLWPFKNIYATKHNFLGPMYIRKSRYIMLVNMNSFVEHFEIYLIYVNLTVIEKCKYAYQYYAKLWKIDEISQNLAVTVKSLYNVHKKGKEITQRCTSQLF